MQSVADRAIQMMQGKENSVFARRYCPKVTFHPGEQHFPCSIEHLLHGSVLKRRAADQWETIKVGPSADELGECNDSQNCYVDISPAQLGGCLPVNHVIDAPVYVAFVEVDDSFIDIYYIFLYAFQGSATFRCWPPGKHFNVITHEFGRHLGDIEHCVVRTDLALSKVISVGYETHDKLAWFLPGEYAEEDGHPLVYASLLNHASYSFNAPTPIPKGGTGDHNSQSQQQWAKTSEIKGALASIDIIERHPNSAVWAPYISDHQLVIVSKDNPATKWVRYAGHFGMPLGTPKFTHATDPSGAGLGMIAKAYVKSIAKIADALHRTKDCDPTRGLGARHYIQQPHVSSWKHIQVLSWPDLVLSANSSDHDAPLILAPVRDGDPHQLWHQDHWRQFGNHRVTATLGMQDIDHLNKEAFVLINKGAKQMLSCGSHGEPMGLVDYAHGCNGQAVRKLILMDTGKLSKQPSVDEKHLPVRLVDNTNLVWTAQVQLVDGTRKPGHVTASAWCSSPDQIWKIVNAKSVEEMQQQQNERQAPSTESLQSNSNNTLAEGQKLVSRDKSHALVMQGDGNLVCYNGGAAVWASKTYNPGTGPFQLVMQQDRNAVIYGPRGAIWATGTDGHGTAPASFVMQDDGKIVIIVGDGQRIWNSS